MITRFFGLVARWRWLITASVFVLLVSFWAFDIYVKRTGLEIVNGWAQNEAVNLQQGNLLPAITKNQRLLLSSDFIRGIALIDRERSSFQELIAFGNRLSLGRVPQYSSDITIQRTGLFRFAAFVSVPSNSRLSIAFLVAPTSATLLFAVYASTLVGFTILFIFRATRVERAEAVKREELLQAALNDFVLSDRPSEIVAAAAPRLVEGWQEMKRTLSLAQEREIQLSAAARFSELARQVAHDIRSPLSALRMVSLSELSSDKQKLVRLAVDRISSVADSMLDRTRGKEDTSTASEAGQDASSKETSTIYLPQLLDDLVSEKRMALGERSTVMIDLRIAGPLAAFAVCDESELMRVLSNLINNAVEAIEGAGVVTVALQVYRDRTGITVADNGKGIPADVLPRLFARGGTFGKANGNGLGLYHARTAVESWGGKLDLQSREGMGTIATITLPKADAPEWLATELDFRSSRKVVVLDDDPSVVEQWKIRLQGEPVEVVGFLDDSSLRHAIGKSRASFDQAFFLVDFQLSAGGASGAAIVDSLGLVDRSVIVTSAPALAAKTSKRVRVLPKSAIGSVAIYTA